MFGGNAIALVVVALKMPLCTNSPRPMNPYDVIRHVHRIGSPITGTVIDRTAVELSHGIPSGYATLATASDFRAILPYDYLADDCSTFTPDLIPNVGDQIETVVFNFAYDTLYLSAKPSDLEVSTIQEWQAFYAYIDTLTIGREITGVVEQARPFGLFVNIGSPYLGLIDVGHTSFNRGHPLPFDNDAWPKVGQEIRCVIGYIRLHNRQIGLGWIPDPAKPESTDTVPFYDFDVDSVVYIPRDEISPGAIEVQIQGINGLVWVLPEQLQKGSIKHSRFDEKLHDYIRQIHGAFAEHRDLTLDEWEDDFRRDENPEREIAIWSHAADVYVQFTADEPSFARRLDIYRCIVTCMATRPDSIWSILEPQVLDRAEAQRVVDRFYGKDA